jgi:hypothetical protein
MTAPATAPIGPSTTAPDKAPNAASPARSSAIAAEDISAIESATFAIVFFIRVPPLSCANDSSLGNSGGLLRWSSVTRLGPNDDTGRILENRGAAATLLELAQVSRD